MEKVLLFTDGSVNTKSNIGYGAYLVVKGEEYSENSSEVFTKRFEGTSSSKLELQTLLWALGEVRRGNSKIIVYTDSQTIVGLNSRRSKLEANNYISKNGKPLNHAVFYQQLFEITDEVNCEFIKVKGHLKSASKTNIDKLFSIVDKASRKALRGI